MALEDKWVELSDDQKAKMKACKTPEEMISLAREDGYELSDSELEAISGGSWTECSGKTGCHSKRPPNF